MLAVVDQNGLVLSLAMNRDILAGRDSDLSNDAPIYIASHTKAFTGTLLKILEEKKQIDLNKSLYDYLPQIYFKGAGDTKEIKIRDLLDHTHGIHSVSLVWKTAFLGYSGDNRELIEDLNTDFQLDSSHGFRYSNVGPILAGMAVEKQKGKTWKSQMQERIFTPLNMEHTHTRASAYGPGEIRPSLRVTTAKGVIRKGFPKRDITMHAAGGIVSTINDLSKWLAANIREDSTLLDSASWAALHTPSAVQDREYFTYRRTGYSLGWDIAEYQGEEILTRFGGLGGISFHCSFMPGRKLGVIAFSNDNRAYLLPHLMANYAYNLANGLSADQIFEGERAIFDQRFQEEDEIIYPEDSQNLRVDPAHDEILGTYKNTKNWPPISIGIKDNRYLFEWGVLSGTVQSNEKGGYSSDLGILIRKFRVVGDTLLTGSLVYVKS